MDAFNDLDLCLLSWEINEDGPFAAFQFGFSLFFLDFDLIPHKSDVRFDVIFLNQLDVNSWVESLNAEFSICPMLKKVQIRKKKKKKKQVLLGTWMRKQLMRTRYIPFLIERTWLFWREGGYKCCLLNIVLVANSPTQVLTFYDKYINILT